MTIKGKSRIHSNRRVYSNKFKLDLIQALCSGEQNLVKIRREYNLKTQDIKRFKTQLVKQGIDVPEIPMIDFDDGSVGLKKLNEAYQKKMQQLQQKQDKQHQKLQSPKPPKASLLKLNVLNTSAADAGVKLDVEDKDKTIAMLLAELGRATLKISQLEAELGGNKRFTDNPVFRSEGA